MPRLLGVELRNSSILACLGFSRNFPGRFRFWGRKAWFIASEWIVYPPNRRALVLYWRQGEVE